MLPMVWLPAGKNEILQTLLYGDARVVPFPNSSTIVELSYTFKAVTLLGIVVVVVIVPIPPGGAAAPPTPGGDGGGPSGGVVPTGGGGVPGGDGGGPSGGVVPSPGSIWASAKLPPLLSIPNVTSNVKSMATLYRILLLNI
jgi:hypothetical protein